MTEVQRVALIVAVVGVLFLSAGVGSVAAQSAPDCSTVGYSGDGTEANSYEVGVVEQLQCIEEQDLGANYTQVSDIDASGTPSWNGGDGFEPIGESPFSGPQFTGTFDGAEYTISGLTIDRGSTDDVGLFGAMDFGGRIENVSLNNVNITGNDNVGGLVGRNFNGIVTESYATGDVSGNLRVGGLIGFNADGTIRESYATGDVSGTADVGGLVGLNDVTVERSYATGDVSGIRVGGIVGTNDGGTVRESYATGDVSGADDMGGLVGRNFNGTVSQSYWDKQSTGQSTSDGGTGLTTSEMTGSAATNNMIGFDFTSTWETVTNPDDYPILAFQTQDGDDDIFTDPLPGFTEPPQNTGELNQTLYEDINGDGDGTNPSEAVLLWSELVQNPEEFNDLTQEQIDALDWNGDGQLTPADAVLLWSEKVQA
jgi:hypothetical protein